MTMKIVDVDQHVIEPANLFANYGTSKFRHRAPQPKIKDGFPGWAFGETFYAISKAATAAGRPWGESGIFVPSEMVPADLGDPEARVRAMDQEGVDRALIYPSFMGLGGETMALHIQEDEEACLDAVYAYNRWLLEEFIGYAPERFIPAVVIPLWRPDIAVAIMEASAAKGAKGFLFPQDPSVANLPPIWDPYWEPIWQAAEENQLVVCCHILSDKRGKYMELRDQPYLALTKARMSGIGVIAEWTLTNVLDRHPDLRVMVGEAGVGWLPWFLQLANQSVRLSAFEFGVPKLSPLEKADNCLGIPILASEQIHPGLIESLPPGLVRRIMFATDYPHLDGSYPNSQVFFHGMGIPEYLKDGIAHSHAEEFFRL